MDPELLKRIESDSTTERTKRRQYPSTTYREGDQKMLQFRLSSTLLTAGILALTLFASAAVNPSAAVAKGKDVTFQNQARHTQQLLVSYGADAKCGEMPKQESVKLEVGESKVVESGESNVCWCSGSGKVEVTSCGEWKLARAGKRIRLTF